MGCPACRRCRPARLEHDEAAPGLAELLRGGKTGGARADDRDVDFGGREGTPGDAERGGAGEEAASGDSHARSLTRLSGQGRFTSPRQRTAAAADRLRRAQRRFLLGTGIRLGAEVLRGACGGEASVRGVSAARRLTGQPSLQRPMSTKAGSSFSAAASLPENAAWSAMSRAFQYPM